MSKLILKELKSVGDCVNLCKSAGIKVSHLDDNLFETAGVIHGLLSQLQAAQETIEQLSNQKSKAVSLLRKLKEFDCIPYRNTDEYIKAISPPN